MHTRPFILRDEELAARALTYDVGPARLEPASDFGHYVAS